jgi:hypothetical protein
LRQSKSEEDLKHHFPNPVLKVLSWLGWRLIEKERWSIRKVVTAVRMIKIHERLEGRKMKAMAERMEKRVASWIDIFGSMKILGDQNKLFECDDRIE